MYTALTPRHISKQSGYRTGSLVQDMLYEPEIVKRISNFDIRAIPVATVERANYSEYAFDAKNSIEER